jgi:hypothetical protein
MILQGMKLFKIQYAVGGEVKPPLVVWTTDMAAADAEVLLFAAAQPEYDGQNLRILAATEIDPETL